jgi:hypothetical protein
MERDRGLLVAALRRRLGELERGAVVGEEAGAAGEQQQLALAQSFRAAQRALVAEALDVASGGDGPSGGGGLAVPTPAEARAAVERAGCLRELPAQGGDEGELARRVQSLNAWVDAEGFPVNLVRAALVPGLRVGTLATAALAAGQTYLAVPSRALLDADNLHRSELAWPFVYYLSEAHGAPDEYHEIVLALILERLCARERSAWWPYLDLLPGRGEVSAPLAAAFLHGTPPQHGRADTDTDTGTGAPPEWEGMLAALEGHGVASELQLMRAEVVRRFKSVSGFLAERLGPPNGAGAAAACGRCPPTRGPARCSTRARSGGAVGGIWFRC